MWTLTKKMAREPSHTLAFTIPIREPLPTQYYIRCATASPATWDDRQARSAGYDEGRYKRHSLNHCLRRPSPAQPHCVHANAKNALVLTSHGASECMECRTAS